MDPKEILFRVHITRSFHIFSRWSNCILYNPPSSSSIRTSWNRYSSSTFVEEARSNNVNYNVNYGGIRIFFFSFNRATLMDFHQRYVLWPHAPVSRFNAWESPQRNPFSPFLLLLLSGEVNVLGKKEKIIREIDTRLTRCTCTRVHHACARPIRY